MDSTSGINSSMYLGANAMRVHSVGMQVAAHNIANVNTAGFEPQRALYATGPDGRGVELEAVLRQRMPLGSGSTVSSERNLTVDGMPPEFSKPSGTELAREFPQMITTQRTFDANAATVRVADEMLGSLLNIKA